LTRDFPSKLELELATLAAEAQVETERIRQTRVTLVNGAFARLRHEDSRLLSTDERAALAFAGKIKVLLACERYERRAISTRNRAIRALARVQRELRREEARELVGPSRPKPPRIRAAFRENVLRLEVDQIMRRSNGTARFLRDFDYQGGTSIVGAAQVATDGNHGFLHLHFQIDGKLMDQTFELAGMASRVGGVRWSVKCPESGKLVRDLYLILRVNHTQFRSRHALGLSYRSSYLKPNDRRRERIIRLMDRLGAEWHEQPLRPKNMQRRIFKRLEGQLWDAWLFDASVNLGVSLDRDALESLGPAQIDEIARERIAESDRRRRRKSSKR
jgi:hypothetical protein